MYRFVPQFGRRGQLCLCPEADTVCANTGERTRANGTAVERAVVLVIVPGEPDEMTRCVHGFASESDSGEASLYLASTSLTIWLRFGERQTEVTLYAAQPDTLPQRDEFLATGGSAYFLKRQDIVEGSKTVTIEVRDEITGRVIERRLLQYGEDYSFDYIQGVLILRRPLSSTTGTSGPVRDGALGGNKVYLSAQYEYTPVATDVDGYAYGGRVQHWVNDKVRVGVTGMEESTGLADQQAMGADVQIRHTETTFLEAEVAHSKGPGFGLSRSTDGGLTNSDSAIAGRPGQSASAWRMRGQVDLQDITGNGMKGIVGGYYEEKEAGFSTLYDQLYVDKRIWVLTPTLRSAKKSKRN